MKETIKLGLILLLITVVSAGVLAISNNMTKDKIAELEMAGSIGALKDIFGDLNFKPFDEGKQEEIIGSNPFVIEIFEALEGDSLVGYAIKHSTKGFGGEIQMMSGFKLDGTLAGMKLLEHGETPGIGAKAEEPDYTDKFVGLSLSNDIAVEIISGATVTSNGVLKGINEARELFNTQLSN